MSENQEKTTAQKALEYLTTNPKATAKDLMTQGVSKSYAYSLIKDFEKGELKPEQTEIRTVETPQPAETAETKKPEQLTFLPEHGDETTEEEEKKKDQSFTNNLKTDMKKGHLDKETIKLIFKVLNEVLDEQEQLEDSTCDLLADLWDGPINTRLEKLADENIDLYLAIGITALIILPKGIRTLRKRMKGNTKK